VTLSGMAGATRAMRIAAENLTQATHNERDFSRILGLKIEIVRQLWPIPTHDA
jgi:hypothetical protein